MPLPATPTTATLKSLTALSASALQAVAEALPRRRTLAEVLAAAPAPTTVAALGPALGVDPVLFARVVARRQPMPRRLAARVAELAGLQPGDVEACAIDLVESDAPSAYRPVPPDPAWGDPLEFAPLARTVEVLG